MNITIPKISEKTITLPDKKDILKGIVLIALSRATLPGMNALGISFAATFPMENSYIALIGLCMGLASSNVAALKYILSFFIYYILLYIKKTEDSMVKAIALGVSVFFAGIAGFFWTGVTTGGVLYLLSEVFVTGGLFYLFTFSEGTDSRANFAQIVLLGGILNGLSGIMIPYLNTSLAAFLILFISMSICYACEAPTAALACTVLGFVMNISNANAIMIAGTFFLSSLLSSLMSCTGKFGTAVGFLCGIASCILYRGSLAGINIADIFMPVAVFVLIPETIHFKISNMINMHALEVYDDTSLNTRVANQLKTVAKAVCDLADGVNLLSERKKSDGEMKEMFDTVSSRVCHGCSLEANCWKKDSRKTYNNMYELWKTIEDDGFCDHTNMPLSFRQVCMRSESFLCELRHVYELYKQNALYRGEALSGREIIARQYGEISNVIKMLSLEVESGLCESDLGTPKYHAVVTTIQETNPASSACGDTLIHFESGNKYYIILCDGMGSGDAAMHESRLTARLFSEFLKAGFEKATALNMINSALALKADQESFSTVDLLEIDLETGICEFMKIGSAESFLKTKGNIETIFSQALPVGILENIEVTASRFQLAAGDLILMVSDGVSEADTGVLKNDWIKKVLSMENRNDEELAKLILVGAKARMRFSDDLTCAVVRIQK